MKLNIQFVCFPYINTVYPPGIHRYDFQGVNIGELISELCGREEEQFNKDLIDSRTGKLDSSMQLIINSKFINFKDKQKLQTILHEGDNVKFLRLLAGG